VLHEAHIYCQGILVCAKNLLAHLQWVIGAQKGLQEDRAKSPYLVIFKQSWPKEKFKYFQGHYY